MKKKRVVTTQSDGQPDTVIESRTYTEQRDNSWLTAIVILAILAVIAYVLYALNESAKQAETTPPVTTTAPSAPANNNAPADTPPIGNDVIGNEAPAPAPEPNTIEPATPDSTPSPSVDQ